MIEDFWTPYPGHLYPSDYTPMHAAGCRDNAHTHPSKSSPSLHTDLACLHDKFYKFDENSEEWNACQITSLLVPLTSLLVPLAGHLEFGFSRPCRNRYNQSTLPRPTVQV
jgi:hypothetical protein